ncbi:MAG: phosphate ABC transporter substrate-binding/OmpA family protein [Pseudomonadota bacterium]
MIDRIGKTALVAGVVASLSGFAAMAEDVTLRLKGGGFEISGKLKSFDGKRYVIASPALGTMTLEADRFDCASAGCPTGPVRARRSALRLTAGGALQQLSIAGSNTIGNQLMPSLIRAYAESNGLKATRIVGADPLDLQFRLSDQAGREVAVIDLRRHGSSTSFREIIAGTAQIGMSSRRIKDKEVATMQPKFGDMSKPGREHVLGLDGLVVIVGPDNPATALTLDQVSKIFAGEITDWSELGLPAAKINLYAPTPDSGTFDTFKSLVLKPFKVKLDSSTKRTPDHGQQADWVARDPQGIGVVGIAYLRNAKALNIASSCGLISQPSVFTMKTEEYPLSRRLYLYTPGRGAKAMARDLLQFSLSKAAQPIVKANDFIDQSPETLPYGQQTPRIVFGLNAPREDFDLKLMRTLIADLKNANRLSSTLRFGSGESQLDTKAQQDIFRLVEVLGTPGMKDKEIVLAGFADSTGGFDANLALSRARANTVRRAILAAPGGRALANRITIKAYSELTPIACNETAKDRRFNRRVEVWLRNRG